jgi:peptidyl-prolyl cis-trans isomerase SurA
MKINLIILLISVVLAPLSAQSDNDVLMTIDGREITSGEFIRVYNKNNSITPDTEKRNVDEYYELFVNYKLKVIEAENLGYDKDKAFVDEFEGYRDQLAKPYLENSGLKEELIKEAYERYTNEVSASHILVTCEANALPEDTLKAYQKIAAIRVRVAGGEPFKQVARATSDDPSVKDNEGYLGYFSAFRMVYPFETAAYNTEVGKVSEIIRTSYGYHVLKVHDRRESRGSIKAAHIMVRLDENGSEPEQQASKEKIQKAYLSLVEGMLWEEAVQTYSENPRTKTKNGELGWLSSGRAPDVFLDPCYETEPGNFTKPIQTKGGYHIAYIIDKKPVESFEEAQEQITRRVERDQKRKEALAEQKYAQLRAKYQVTIFPEELDALANLMDSTFYTGQWAAEKASGLSNSVVTIENKSFSTLQFAEYVTNKRLRLKGSEPIIGVLNAQLENYANENLYNYALEQLPKENADYRYLIQEYHDGILLFNLTNEEVWEKAQSDTSGLEAYYKKGKKYQWNERIEVNIYKYEDNTISTKLPDLIKKQQKKNLDNSFLINELCASDSTPCIFIENKTYEKGQDAMADKLPWIKGANRLESDKDWNYLYYVVDTWDKKDKSLNEARGLYIADYQAYLEEAWIAKLREKYIITVDEEVFNNIKSELN